MSRTAVARDRPKPSTQNGERAPRPLRWGNTLFRRARSFLANAIVESLSATGRMHPAAAPERHGVELVHDVAYGPDPQFHRLDIYKPHRPPAPDGAGAAPKPWPVVFYVHGGAFHLLSKDTHWLMGLVFARFGYLVVNISYRLAPRHPFPAAIEDVCSAYGWLADHVRELGGDPDRVAVAGESAGANLVSALSLAAVIRRPEPWARAVFDRGLVPRAVLPFCGILQASETDRFRKRRNLPWWVDGMIRDAGASYLHGHPATRSPATALADPLLLVEDLAAGGAALDRPLPPFFAPVGTRDPLLDDTRRLEKALHALGVPCEARYYPGGIHAFHALVWDPAARRCWRDALAFLDRHMRAAR